MCTPQSAGTAAHVETGLSVSVWSRMQVIFKRKGANLVRMLGGWETALVSSAPFKGRIPPESPQITEKMANRTYKPCVCNTR
jgi:hypothetical protein